MNKQDADKYIFRYLDKIFGFSLDKMKNIEQAQELASDIVYQVYLSFLRKDDIINLDGYVYRIARNVYARYIHQLETDRIFESIEGMAIPFHDTYESVENNDIIERLKREIGYLSKRQRMVIYMHYYDKLSVKEIALAKAVWCTNAIGSPTVLPRIIEKLLEKRLLEPLNDIQSKSVFSIICLPEYE